MNLKNLKISVTNALMLGGKITRKRGRSQVDAKYVEKQRKGPAAPIPDRSIRGDSTDHWPEYVEKRCRCKLPGCQSITKIVCFKCKAHLCFTPRSNCFKKFHALKYL